MRIMLSVKKPIRLSILLIWIPVIFGEALTECARGSMTKADLRGDSGQPCLVLLVIMNADDNALDE